MWKLENIITSNSEYSIHLDPFLQSHCLKNILKFQRFHLYYIGRVMFSRRLIQHVLIMTYHHVAPCSKFHIIPILCTQVYIYIMSVANVSRKTTVSVL